MLSIVHGARQQPLGIFSATRAPEEYATYRQRAPRRRAAAAPLLPAWLRRSGTDGDRARAPAARPARRGRRTARGARVHRPRAAVADRRGPLGPPCGPGAHAHRRCVRQAGGGCDADVPDRLQLWRQRRLRSGAGATGPLGRLMSVDPTRVPQRAPKQPLWLSAGDVARAQHAPFVRALRLGAKGERVWADDGEDHVGSARLAYGDERIYRWLLSFARA